MPAPPLHYCVAYMINKARIGLVLPALFVGSVIPDAEALVGYLSDGRLAPPRGLMHSLLGAVTLDTFLAVLITVLIYPRLAAWIFKIEKKSAVDKCGFSFMLVVSAVLGSLSHVLIDATSHEYNPLLYPFITQSFDAFVLFDNWLLASVIVHIVLFGLLSAILVYEFRKGTEGFWKRLLIE